MLYEYIGDLLWTITMYFSETKIIIHHEIADNYIFIWSL